VKLQQNESGNGADYTCNGAKVPDSVLTRHFIRDLGFLLPVITVSLKVNLYFKGYFSIAWFVYGKYRS